MDLYATLNVGFRETHRGKSPAVPLHSEKGLSSDFERFRQRRWRGRYFTRERTDLAIESEEQKMHCCYSIRFSQEDGTK
jgi:hypothetical protein